MSMTYAMECGIPEIDDLRELFAESRAVESAMILGFDMYPVMEADTEGTETPESGKPNAKILDKLKGLPRTVQSKLEGAVENVRTAITNFLAKHAKIAGIGKFITGVFGTVTAPLQTVVDVVSRAKRAVSQPVGKVGAGTAAKRAADEIGLDLLGVVREAHDKVDEAITSCKSKSVAFFTKAEVSATPQADLNSVKLSQFIKTNGGVGKKVLELTNDTLKAYQKYGDSAVAGKMVTIIGQLLSLVLKVMTAPATILAHGVKEGWAARKGKATAETEEA